KISDSVVRDEKVDAAIVIEVRSHHSKGFTAKLSDAARLADVCERAIAVVVKEPARGMAILLWAADFGETCDIRNIWCATAVVFGIVKVDVATKEEIEADVVVVIEPGGAGRPPRSSKA